MKPFISHPSVRIKGTENIYEPSTCVDPKCQKSWFHMHCPFCVKAETFQDPVILKAHYRVKHVDKGLEFAGLKILRCCEHCDIVGTIKGTKDFKGAHWHCYKCRNGFTRRDEAIKHYRTHFRNPSTTFQIQVAQDINQSVNDNLRETDSAIEGVTHDIHLMETVVTSANIDADLQSVLSVQAASTESLPSDLHESEKSSSSDIQVSVAANETVGTCDGQTIMIIQDSSHVEGGEIIGTFEAPMSLGERTGGNEIIVSAAEPSPLPGATSHWRKERANLDLRVKELKQENEQLKIDRANVEHQLSLEVNHLRTQLQMAHEEIDNYQKREVELLDQLKIPLDDQLSSLLFELKQQHEELLHHQLAQLKRTYVNQQFSEPIRLKVSQVSEDGSPQSGEISLLTAGKDSEVTMESMVNYSRADSGSHMTSSTIVLTPDTYGAIPAGALHSGNLVLKSESLLEGGPSTPLFVVPQTGHLHHIKRDDSEVVESEEIMEGTLLEETVNDDPSAPLVEYTQEHDDEAVTSCGLADQVVLLNQESVVTTSISSSVVSDDKSDTYEIDITDAPGQELDISSKNVEISSISGKRKAEDRDNNRKSKKLKE